MALQPGLNARVGAVVDQSMTARGQGSGEVDGLATPAMIALMESAAVKAVARELAPDLTTVGARVEVTHLAPTPMGMRVEARATLLEIEGRQLVFAVSAEDEAGVIGRGTHERVVVRRRGFAEKIEGRRVEAGLRFAGPNERPGG